MPKLRVRHALVALLLLVAMLGQGTWALAGTTGGISGYVHDTDGVAVADARVTANSPSEQTSATTDSAGHFAFLSLAPDTYTISVTKTGYQDTSIAGTSVFADQVQTVSITMPKQLKTIVNTRSAAASSLVKSGVGGDIYSVDPAQMQKTAALGGGGNLDNAYSAIASVPGVAVGTGGMGWNQAVVVRGANPWTTGFEYDGIPVNRSFDNYTASTASNLGLQELQVYTGGGPASISSTGVSGFINQVIKTGTYPGYGTLSGGLAAIGAFYHSARVEAGGATPNRNFSYYVGVSGYDQAARVLNNSNGADVYTPGSALACCGFTLGASGTGPNGQVVAPMCNTQLGLTDPNLTSNGCIAFLPDTFGCGCFLTDRENVANFHFGVPRKDGQKDDIQLMGSISAEKSYFNTSLASNGDLNTYLVAISGYPYCSADDTGEGCATLANAFGPGTTNFGPGYIDAITFNTPFGTDITGMSPQVYAQPNTPAHAVSNFLVGNLVQTPLDSQDLYNNDTGIVKLQWTHPFSSRAFGRLMGYTFFSDWTEDGVNSAYLADFVGYEPVSPNYDLVTHTAGGMVQYFDQITDKHLLQFTGNYTHASVNRFNNTGFLAGDSPVGLISQSGGTYTCYDSRSGDATYGQPIPCIASAAHVAGGAAAFYGGTVPAEPAACADTCIWSNLWNGNASGTFNSVRPDFYSASLEDQWRPTDKLVLNLSARYDDFRFGLAPPGPQDAFYAQEVQDYACWSPTLGTLAVPLGPGQFAPAPLQNVIGPCPSGYAHPNGTTQNGVFAPMFTATSPSSYNMNYWSPRVSGTYTQNPDTVWRFSAGRFVEPPLSAATQYLYRGGSGANLWGNFMNLGFFSPFHPITAETSAQYDLSLEKRIHGTPWSIKLTPFYGATSNWEEQSFIGAGFVTQIPVGRAREYGVEAALNYGDFNKEGLSGLLTFTYTKSEAQFQPLLGSSQIQQMNIAIDNFNALTKGGGGAACYTPANAGTGAFGTADPACAAGDIANPYYTMASQPHLDPNGWYPQGITALFPAGLNPSNATWFASPYVTNVVLNYRHAKFAITPSLQLQAGSQYGSPYDIEGLDPRVCAANQGTTGVTPGSQLCDYTTAIAPGDAPAYSDLYIPNPQTGKFASPGGFNEPTIAIFNLQASYDVSPKVTLQMTAADLWHTCFGGSKEPWTTAYAPSQYNCGYYDSGNYVGATPGAGFFNGASPSTTSANNGITPYPFLLQSYLPKANTSVGGFLPFTLYLQAQIKL